MKKIAVVTSVVGVDSFELYSPMHKNADYYLYTDQNIQFDGWITRKLYPASLDNVFRYRRTAKIPKILAHYLLPEYDYFIWHDSTNMVKEDPSSIVDKYLLDSDFAFFKHPHRNCWKEEALEIIRNNRDYPELVKSQIAYYEKINVREKEAFYEATTFVRRNSDLCNAVCSLWHEHIDKFSSRDQISLPAALQMFNAKVNILPGNASIYYGNNDIIPAIRHTLHIMGKAK